LRGIGDGVIATDIDGNVVLMNEVAEKLTAWPQADAIGKPLDKIFRIIDEKTRELCENPFERVLEKGIVVGLTDHTVLIARDGTERCVADSGAPIWDHNFDMNGVVVVFRDITNQRRGELEQQKAEKLQSVGVLAGGIAHDFNNFLTVILGNINFAKMLIKPEDEIYALLNEVEKASQSAKGLTHQLLTFSKGGLPVKKDMSLLDLIHDSAGFVLRGSNVGCEYNLPDDLWHADVDEGQLTQVLHNLMINAVQAMPTGGKIEVEGENVIVGEGSPLPLKKGKYVRISLKDHGTGIAKENLPFIFDPYFSTKKKGSGLGLSTTYSIIHQHDGYLSVDSEAGAGATFQFYLPASKKKFRKKVVPEKIPELSRARFLIMDDEEAILELLRKFMAKVGLDAEFATGGEEAVEKYKAAKGSARPFDVVVLDLTVPGGMGGREAMRRLKELDPTAKAIVSSGYSNDSILSNYHEFGFSEVLSKPYDMHELMEKLYKVLRATKE
jgi:PAS domain S-box-containing protein